MAIERQRLWAGKLVLVCRCHACRERFRLETLDAAHLVLDSCRASAQHAESVGKHRRAIWWNQVADRIITGYTTRSDLAPSDT